MIWQILIHTPTWVFFVLFGLVLLGWQQSRDRSRKPWVLALVPAAMAGLSYGSLLSSFGAVIALQLLWLAALGLFAAAVGAYLPIKGVRAEGNRIFIPGSWGPLILMLALFFTKYAVGAASAMAPQWVDLPSFKLTICVVYGAFSGVFVGRALAIWRETQAQKTAGN